MKDQKTKNTKFIEKKVKADNSVEYIIKKSPMQTWWGKTILVLILIGMVVIPVVALISLLASV